MSKIYKNINEFVTNSGTFLKISDLDIGKINGSEIPYDIVVLGGDNYHDNHTEHFYFIDDINNIKCVIKIKIPNLNNFKKNKILDIISDFTHYQQPYISEIINWLLSNNHVVSSKTNLEMIKINWDIMNY